MIAVWGSLRSGSTAAPGLADPHLKEEKIKQKGRGRGVRETRTTGEKEGEVYTGT